MVFHVYRNSDTIQNLPREKIKQKETRRQWSDSFKWLKEKKKIKQPYTQNSICQKHSSGLKAKQSHLWINKTNISLPAESPYKKTLKEILLNRNDNRN